MEENQHIEDETKPSEINREPEIVPVPDAEPIASQTQPESTTMEVHKHTHTPRNKWSHYFWEFLMLFLAVFCGFLAEYKLEHVIENQREATLMQSLSEDLQADETTLKKYFDWRTEVNRDFDSLLLMLSKPDYNNYAYLIYQKSNASVLRFGTPDIHEGTIQQLKNAGGLRLVRKKEVLNAINDHYLSITRMKSSYEIEVLLRVKLTELMAEILDAKLLINENTPPETFRLMPVDESKINHIMNSILAAKRLNKRLMTHLEIATTSTTELNKLIKENYHFDKN